MASIWALAARQGARQLLAALLEAGEQPEDLLEVLGHSFLVAAGEGAMRRFSPTVEVREHRPALGHLDDAWPTMKWLGWLWMSRPLPVDAPGQGPVDPGDGLEQGGFTRPVGAQEGDQLALLHPQAHVVQRATALP